MDFAQLVSELKKAEKYYIDEHISLAIQSINFVENEYKLLSDPHETQMIKDLLLSDKIKEIKNSGKEIQILLNLFKRFNDRHNNGESNSYSKEIKTNCVKDGESGHYYFKVEGEIHFNILYCVAAFLEIDLYPVWMPRCVESFEVKRISKLRRIVYNMIDCFIFNRESLILGFGDTLDDGSVFLYVKSIDGTESWVQDIPLPEKKCPRVELEGGFRFRTLKGEKDFEKGIYFESVFRVDPHIPFVPTWL